MKKFSLIAIVFAFAAIAFTSCKKDYTCTCDVTWENSLLFPTGDTTFTSSATFEDAKKDDAEASCNAGDATEDDGLGGTITSACELD